jgi:hypothetical protein
MDCEQESGSSFGSIYRGILSKRIYLICLVLIALVSGFANSEAYIGFGSGGIVGRIQSMDHYQFYTFFFSYEEEKDWMATGVDIAVSLLYSFKVGFKFERIGVEFRWFYSHIYVPRQSWSAEQVSGTTLDSDDPFFAVLPFDGEIEIEMTVPGVSTLFMFWPLGAGERQFRVQPYIGLGLCNYFPQAESTLVYDHSGNLFSTGYEDRTGFHTGILFVSGCNLQLFNRFRLYGEVEFTRYKVHFDEEDVCNYLELTQFLVSASVGVSYYIATD